jgi:mRNA interferase YafQ
MYSLNQTTKFKKDLKIARKRGLKMELLDDVVTTILATGKLPPKFKPHILKGNYKGLWECHIQPDWLLIWKQDEEIKLISLTRTGSHSDLF